MIILCVDPGITGGLCELDTETQDVKFYPMPIMTYSGKKTINVRGLMNIIEGKHYDIIGMEKVHAMTGQGVSSSFSFGYTTGIIFAILQTYYVKVSTYILYEEFAPQTWKKFATLLLAPKDEVLTRVTGNVLEELNKVKTKVHRIACAEAFFMCKYMENKHNGK